MAQVRRLDGIGLAAVARGHLCQGLEETCRARHDFGIVTAPEFDHGPGVEPGNPAAAPGQVELIQGQVHRLEQRLQRPEQGEHLRLLAIRPAQAGQEFVFHLASIGLPEALSPADLADWLHQHDSARNASDDLLSVQEATEIARQTGEALRQALAAVPGLQAGDDLDTLFRMAQSQAEVRKAQLADLQGKRDAHARDACALAARQAALNEARTACEAAEALWNDEAITALPAGTAIAKLSDALPGLRGLREINETVTGLTRQIAGMTRDRDAFTVRIAPHAKAMAAPAAQLPLDTYRLVREALTAAETAAEEAIKLTANIATAREIHAKAVADLTTQDAQIRQLSAAFDPAIPTATLPGLRNAVTQGKLAIDLRTAISRLGTALTTRLAVADRSAAEAALASQPLAEAEAELAMLADETSRITKAVEDAIEARSKAEVALNRVQGDADVARLVARRRLIEVEMQDGALRYLEDRFAHMLAERAIRRYRDAHRSGMLEATEAAFRILTNGAYTKLSTQPEGATEALVATQAAGGSAKQAREMSKGTRFQLDLALRAAASEQVAVGGTVLPFFCDDIFETFDEARTTAACGLMRQIGQRGQAIYLTHHKHVVDLARKLCGDEVRVHDLAG